MTRSCPLLSVCVCKERSPNEKVNVFANRNTLQVSVGASERHEQAAKGAVDGDSVLHAFVELVDLDGGQWEKRRASVCLGAVSAESFAG